MLGSGQSARSHLDIVKTVLARYPRLYSLLRTSKTAWSRFHPSDQRLYRERAQRIHAIEREVQQIEARYGRNRQTPILFFNATSGPGTVSFNAIAGLLISWALRVAGQSVMHLVCRYGMPKCIQGTNLRGLDRPLPCEQCFQRRSELFPPDLSWFLEADLEPSDALPAFEQYSLDDLMGFVYQGVDLGSLCLPSVRWTLRRHHLSSASSQAQRLFREYLRAGIRIVNTFERLVKACTPRSAVVFNGTFFPEAIIRTLAINSGLSVVTYEVGYRSKSLFLSHDVVTAYSIQVPNDFEMGTEQEAELDHYLAQRVKGKFTMGGLRFWPEMKSVNPELRRNAKAYRQVVTVFTNVVYDTSQIHANTIFESMFDWLDETMRLAVVHPETLFIVRAHPDEFRPGRESQEPVEQWLKARGYLGLPNLVFIPPTEYVSSYELIQLSEFCIVYNSTISLEATLLGTPVVTGGRTKESQEGITHAPASREAYRDLVASFLKEGVSPLLQAWQQRARRFMYYMLFRTALDLSAFVEPLVRYGYAIKPVQAQALHPDRSPEMRIIYDGIINNKPFHYT